MLHVLAPSALGFQNINAIRQAKARVQAGREDLRTIEQTTLLDAATAHVNVVRDQAVVGLTDRTSRRSATASSLNILSARRSAGPTRKALASQCLIMIRYDPIEHYDIVKNKWLGLTPPPPPAPDE